jgi:hypothetical protein
MNKWDVWKAVHDSYDVQHFFVIISPPSLLPGPRVNALVCHTRRPLSEIQPYHVVLDAADGLEHPSLLICSYVFEVKRERLTFRTGVVSLGRRRAILDRIMRAFSA